ncbi:MAG TPA: AAC(3) family N-acetyltransferase [Pyrinomonadaceae bacterium]|nr:AAC(3) family N-acetyltransferase [Pyrinomonadaceae bacterium]
MTVNAQDIRGALRSLGLSGRAACAHSSLRSFGRADGGARAVVRAFLDEGCTLLVPTFSSAFEITPPAHLRFGRNGWDYELPHASTRERTEEIYTTDSTEIDRGDMGAVPAGVVSWPGRVRGGHPTDSFAAVGPRAAELVSGQSPVDVYAPLAELARAGGYVVLMGVGLERMTLLHLAEKESGRVLFRRWAKDERGRPSVIEAGGCSEGFGRLEPYLSPITRTAVVGQSTWKILPAAEAVALAAAAIRADPRITHCGVADCERCNDAVAGGPVV